jgi:hypothetical protein
MDRLTGNKDTDFLILNRLTDHELTKVCQVNRYIRSICNDDKFWVIRTHNIFNLTIDDIYRMKEYLGFDNVQELYKYLVSFPVTTNYGTRIFGYEVDSIDRNYVVKLFKTEKLIDKVINDALLPEGKTPKWINRKELIYAIRRKIPNALLIAKQDKDKKIVNKLSFIIDSLTNMYNRNGNPASYAAAKQYNEFDF